jgi:uncharacterized membrane protein YtjA (UPF0391 family)
MQTPDPDNRPWSRRRWLARLSFSFLIISIFLAYTGYRGAQDHTLGHGRILLCYFASMVAFVLFLMGARERHRPR